MSQEKGFENNRWHKLDNFGYEALSETVISKLINHTNISSLGFNSVSYRIEKLNVHSHQRIACSSENFLKSNQSLITLETNFTEEKIMQALEPALEYYPKLYIPYIKERVLTCIKTQEKKLFG